MGLFGGSWCAIRVLPNPLAATTSTRTCQLMVSFLEEFSQQKNDKADRISIDSHASWMDLVTGQARKFGHHLAMSLHCVYLLLDGHPPKYTASQLAAVAQVPRPNHLPPPSGDWARNHPRRCYTRLSRRQSLRKKAATGLR